ncbi:substrate-binding domain-containing protein [Chloroflexota bacterium]
MKKILIPLFIVAAIVLTSCSPAATPVATEAPMATEAPEKTFTIGLAMPEIKGSFWQSIYYGVTDEAKLLGAEVIAVEAGGFQNVDKQISQIEDLIQREVDILLVGATSSEGVIPVVDEAIAAGIPVVGISSLPANENLTIKIGADHYTMGSLLATCIGEALGGEGDVVMAAGPAGVIWATLRANGFKETMAADFPNITIVSELNTPTGRDQGITLMEDWLQTFPDLKAVYSATDDIGAGAADALASAGKEGTVVNATCNLSPIGREYLVDGKIQCEAIQQIVLQGREAVRQGLAYLKGETFVDFLKTDVLLATKDNLDSLDLSDFQAPEGFVPDL